MINTKHNIIFGNAINLDSINDESIDLVITSPSYPMIEMWDIIFGEQNPDISDALRNNKPYNAFELMHKILDLVWSEVFRVLKKGGIACINIGDATRTIGDFFQLFNSHSRIINYCLSIGFQNLPNIIWRKQTNAPNKFMGSGMLPPSAYVTLEHEYVLIFRKGQKRIFRQDEKKLRSESAYFWEERNIWFSDIWDFKGIGQKLNNSKTRERSAAFPFELPYRLINMFSIKGDRILDPFVGTGTTTLAAIIGQRNSVGIELDPNLLTEIKSLISNKKKQDYNNVTRERFLKHLTFVNLRQNEKGEKSIKYVNNNYGFPVMTRQEQDILINFIKSISIEDELINVEYFKKPMLDYQENTLFNA